MEGRLDGNKVLFTHVTQGFSSDLSWRPAGDYSSSPRIVEGNNDNANGSADGGVKNEDVICVTPSSKDQAGVADGAPSHLILLVDHEASDKSDAVPPHGSLVPVLRSLRAHNLPLPFLQSHEVPKLPPHLSVPSSAHGPNIHILISTHSGAGHASAFNSAVLQPLLSHLSISTTDYSIHHTQSATTLHDLTTTVFIPRARLSIPQTLILLSGDGGVHEISDSLLSPSFLPHPESYLAPTLCLVPLGTANALAHSIQTPPTRTYGLSALLKGSPSPVPFLRATFSPGSRPFPPDNTPLPVSAKQCPPTPILHAAIVVSYGLHASLVANSDTPAYRAHGSSRFQLAAQELLHPPAGGPPHPYAATVSFLPTNSPQPVTWTPIRRSNHAYILLSLVSNLEASFTISPHSTPLSPRPHLIHFGALPAEKIEALMQAAYAGGKHVDDENVGDEVVEGTRVEMREAEGEWRRVCVDGRIVEVEEGGWVEVRRVIGREEGEGAAMVVR
ncbi:MAG: hypothetical protein M1833_001219 [Piccolia ochrophora]|nr:MAG: hypothetical protein M1833_001219 [Piccolia ochrophora]